MNISIPIPDTIEFIDFTPINPLISKCKIKVLYVGDEPNRNRSIITKEAATKIAASLPGSPIVGYYNETDEDYEEHNKFIVIKDGKLSFSTNTVPYGFVDINAKVWFEDYNDDGVIRTYLLTEGYIWTGQYPESQKIIDEGRPHSLEFDNNKDTLDAYWTKDSNGKKQFFIINEAIVKNLCVLGNDVEPCFEGSSITEFSLDTSFKDTMFQLVQDMKNILERSEQQMDNEVTLYAVELGCPLWETIWSKLKYKLEVDYPEIYGVYEDKTTKFVVYKKEGTLYRLNFTYNDETFEWSGDAAEVAIDFVEKNGQYNKEEYLDFAKKKEEEEAKDKNPEEDKTEEEEEKKVKYVLEEVVEYQNLLAENEALQNKYNDLEAKYNELVTYKSKIEKKEKEALINSFSLLSEEDVKEMKENINTYSYDDLKSKLCVLHYEKQQQEIENENEESEDGLTYSLDADTNNSMPPWVKAVDTHRNRKENQ